MTKKINIFGSLGADLPSGLVVFLVALPLCLGIALASGAPLFAGIITGVVGGIVVGYLSKSHLSVSGPAAGLTAIVLTAITDLGGFSIFLLAVFLAGLMQIALGFLKAGSISNYFPNNVIEGMLAGIGVIIFLKQIPHAFGYDKDYEGDLAFAQPDGQNTFSEIFSVLGNIHLGATIITIISLTILIGWNKVPFLKNLKLVPAALVAVIVGIVVNQIFIASGSTLAVLEDHLVKLPVPNSFDEFKQSFTLPDFTAFSNQKVWIVAVTIAVVASIETLLCIEAADRMDKHKRYTDTNVELKAQGIGNMVSALLGGLPMTSVVVRTTANSNAGAETKMSAIFHGVLLMVCAIAIPSILNMIPLATLAAVLLLVGYKLANPKVIKHFFERGKYQFIPFMATMLAVVFTDLLKGVALGLIISVIFILKGNMQRAYNFRKEEYHDGDVIHIDLAQEVSFLNKAAVKKTLSSIPENSKVVINASDTVYIAHDVLDLIKEFKKIRAKEENIKIKLVGFKKAYKLENTGEEEKHVFVEHKN
ncbi:SulP family inorganic anion transporter [Flavobacterium amnicola]|uniref:SulP family inorganic anion transporter n=1 Tax=Flavobacterium amnicola TaxID=2506422 RepID=A0A4Q1K4A3_9FLAO|nr:SulP family inorganic anion transporter [Flavobacterium amnicola]RXR20538.1 SulP family inorganic anion transporter [Flavobacterium amnicola]